MAVGTGSRGNDSRNTKVREHPTVTLCEGRPGTAILLESDNTDGWIASDTILAIDP